MDLVAILVVRPTGKILVLRRGPNKSYPGLLCLPGGKVEDGESAWDAAARELFEETGLKGNLDRFRTYHIPGFIRARPEKFNNHWNGYHLFHVFILHVNYDAVAENREPNKHSDLRWVSPAEFLAEKELLPFDAETVRYHAELSRTRF